MVFPLSGQDSSSANFSQSHTVTFGEINEGVPTYYGMAAYYNGVQSYINSDMELSSVEPGKEVVLQEGEHFVALGREQALVVEGNGTTIRLTENAIEFWSASVGSAESSSYF